MLAKPSKVLPGVHHFKLIGHVVSYPLQECRIFQIRDNDEALLYSCSLAKVSQNETILATAPRISHSLATASLANVRNGPSRKLLYMAARTRLLNAFESIEPILIVDMLLSTEHIVLLS